VKLPRRKTTINLTALLSTLLISQSLAPLAEVGQSAHAFGFGKKQSSDEKEEGAKGSDAKGEKDKAAKAEKGAKGEKTESAKADEPKEKVKGKSKEDIKEEEELEAEYLAHQKELSALLKTVKTPFGSAEGEGDKGSEGELSPVTISGSSSRAGRLSLGQRLLQSKLYMPGRMMIGHFAEFTVRGRPGYWAALAMADRDKGAKPIYGRDIRLGPDRKVVALGKIPASGVLQLKVFTPIAGDLIGSNLFFEAAIWPENNPAQLELAQPVSSETQAASTANSVVIIGEGERKHGLKFVPDNTSPYAHADGPGISSGRP